MSQKGVIAVHMLPTREVALQERPKSGRELLAGSSDDTSRRVIDDWFDVAYNELHRLAAMVKRNDANATIGTSTLVHEAWMKLAASASVKPDSELHFKRIAARVMRQIVMDAARRRCSEKHGGHRTFVVLDHSIDIPELSEDDFLRLDEALDELAKQSPRQAELVVLRFFGGFSNSDMEAILDVKETTILREWKAARAWMAVRLKQKS